MAWRPWPGGPGLEASALRPWPGGWAWKLWHGICGMEALSFLTESDSMASVGIDIWTDKQADR